MSTTAVHPQNYPRSYPHYSDSVPSSHRQSHLPTLNGTLAYHGYPAPNDSTTPSHPPSAPKGDPPKSRPSVNGSVTTKQESPSMASSSSASRRGQRPDWYAFYGGKNPKEIIVIDDTPPPAATSDASLSRKALPESTRHQDKKRRTDAAYDPVHHSSSTANGNSRPEASTASASLARTASGHYSTGATSLASATNGANGRYQKLDESKAGQKRKRPAGADNAASPEIEVVAQNQNNAWCNYVPPPRPPVKAKDVKVEVVRDRYPNTSAKIDDDDGHYIVSPDAELTDRYQIVRLLGQGTFGKVVEAIDRRRGRKVAVKIIRAIPKYRDASRIELRVLSTLAHNDSKNRNRCIHLRDCFDYRNHICIVTDLLGKSVFDFLKDNNFVPFPSTHIQTFARQLFTSVAFLHDLNLIHTDLKPENILLVNHGYQTFTYNRLIPTSTRNNPRQAKLRKVLLDPEIRLIDFGSATFDEEYHSSVVSTRHYRAPEIILQLGWSYPCDIWSIGCILVEFFTGDALFQTHDNLEHLAMMEAVCGHKIDKEMISQVRAGSRTGKTNAANFFLPRAFRLDYPNTETPRTSKRYVKNMKSLGTLKETIPPQTEFNRQFLDLLKRIFVYDPKKRITAKQALQHPWFRETLQDDGTEALKIRLKREEERHGDRNPYR